MLLGIEINLYKRYHEVMHILYFAYHERGIFFTLKLNEHVRVHYKILTTKFPLYVYQMIYGNRTILRT